MMKSVDVVGFLKDLVRCATLVFLFLPYEFQLGLSFSTNLTSLMKSQYYPKYPEVGHP